MHGSTGGRWKRASPVGHLRVPGRCAERRHHDDPVGTQPTDQPLPRQRSTLLRIQRHQKRGTQKRYVYTYPSKKSLASVKAKVRSVTRGSTDQSLSIILHRLNPVLRGWTNYFRHGVSKATFSYLRAFVWRRVICWLRHKHRPISWKQLRRNYLLGWWPAEDGVVLFNPSAVVVTRYRYRANRIPTPWAASTEKDAA